MTIDDESSIYVGGIPYEISEDSLRKVFDVYGAVVAVKIINDRSMGGKCYGFVTFSNPRSAMQAIKEMDGKTIDGRVVRVNEVRTRGARPDFSRENSRRDFERGSDGNIDRDRVSDDSRGRHRYQKRSLGSDQDSERGYEHRRVRYVDGERSREYNRHVDDDAEDRERKHERGWERDNDHQNMDEQRNSSHHKREYDKPQEVHLMKRSSYDDRGDRKLSLEPFDEDQDQVESKLEVANQKLEDLLMEMSQIEELVVDQEDIVSNLRDKYQKLEDSLISAKKFNSDRHIQAAKLHKCCRQLRNYNERVENTEQELQSLVHSTMMDMEKEGDGILPNGRV